MILPDDLVKGSRTITAGENGVRHKMWHSSFGGREWEIG
jgi:hypothetical protein